MKKRRTAKQLSRVGSNLTQLLTGVVDEDAERRWKADFDKLPLDDARDVARWWLRRLGEYTGGVEEIEDLEVLKQMAVSARREFLQKPSTAIGSTLNRIDSAADSTLEAQAILEERFGVKLGVWSDIQAMLKQAFDEVEKVRDSEKKSP